MVFNKPSKFGPNNSYQEYFAAMLHKPENFFTNSSDSKLFSFPVGEHLSESDIDRVCKVLKDFK